MMDQFLYQNLIETIKLIQEQVKINKPVITKHLDDSSEIFGKAVETIIVFKPQIDSFVRSLAPIIEILPDLIDAEICGELSAVCFVLIENPSNEFASGLIEAGKSTEFKVVDDDIEAVYPIEAIDEFLRNYLYSTDFQMANAAIAGIDDELRNDPLWRQSLSAYYNKDYDLSILGFVALTDRLLSKYSGNNGIRIKERANAIANRIRENRYSEYDKRDALLINTYVRCAELYAQSTSFSSLEPQIINRHWLAHGRRTSLVTQLDCIKVIHLMYGTIEIGKMDGNVA